MSEVRQVDVRAGSSVLRGALLAILVVGIAGTWAELLLLDHTESWQLVPVVLLGAGLAVLAWHAMRPRPVTVRMVRAAMVIYVASGFAGLALHLKGNVEFERELHPGTAVSTLAWNAMKGATPALAPGTMIHLGLLGLLYAHVAGREQEKEK